MAELEKGYSVFLKKITAVFCYAILKKSYIIGVTAKADIVTNILFTGEELCIILL